jgi:L,D-transpeptidase ErfK/SrfK
MDAARRGSETPGEGIDRRSSIAGEVAAAGGQSGRVVRRRGPLGLTIVCGLIAGLLLGVTGGTAHAWTEEEFFKKTTTTYKIGPGESLVGGLTWYRVRKGDTLYDIARQFSLGYNEIVERNPGLDVWLPPPGAVVMLPTEWILPCCIRRGLIVNIPEMRMYYLRPTTEKGVSEVITYAVGLGREDWQTPRGKFTVRDKTVNPTWVIPESIRKEHIADRGDARTVIPGGTPDNPLGKHRLSLSLPSYGIHGTNIPWGVGMEVSHGCLRLYPEDIERLFPEVPVGTPGEIVYQPVKVAIHAGEVYVQIARDIYGLTPALWKEARAVIDRLGVADRVDGERLMAVLQSSTGIPVRVSGPIDKAIQLALISAPPRAKHDGPAGEKAPKSADD